MDIEVVVNPGSTQPKQVETFISCKKAKQPDFLATPNYEKNRHQGPLHFVCDVCTRNYP